MLPSKSARQIFMEIITMPNDETNSGYTDPTDKTALDTNAIPTDEQEAEAALDTMFQDEPTDNVLPEEAKPESDTEPEGESQENPENEASESEENGNPENPEGEDGDGDSENGDSESPEEDANPADEDKEDVPEGLFNEKQQAVFQREIGKVRGKLQTARAELENANTKLSELQSQKMAVEGELMRVKAEGVVPPPSKDNPLAGVIDSEQELQGYKAVQFSLREQIKESMNEDGAVVLVNGRQVQLTPEEAKAELSRIDRFFDLDLPHLEQHIRSSQMYDARLYQEFPEAAKPNTPVSLAINSIIASNPVIKRLPGYHAASYVYAVGQLAVKKWGVKEAWNVVNGEEKAQAQRPTVKTAKAKAVAKAISRTPPPPPAKKNTPKMQGTPPAKVSDGPLTAEDAEDALYKKLYS